MDKENEGLMWMGVILGLSYLALWLIVLFGFYGGNPQGVYWRIVDLEEEMNEFKADIISKQQFNEQAEQIEIIRNQLAQIKLNVKKRHNR